MRAMLAVLRRLLLESRWTLAINAAAMFLFGWLNTHIASRQMDQIREAMRGSGGRRFRMLREIAGGDVTISVANVEVSFWLHPFLWLPVVVWAVGRGSIAVAGEVERGTLDLALSRPISRFSYLVSQVTLGLLGLVLLAASLVAGNRLAINFNPVEEAPTTGMLFWPALNLAALGFAIFALTLAASSADRVRWRSLLLGSFVTMAGFVAWVVSNLEVMAGSPWLPWLRRVALFETYNPVDAVGLRAELGRNLAVLGSIGGVGLVLAFVVFLWRDLPTNG
jgi:ABC-2 type transport system permease protein